jgi:hypothetical protein
MLQFFTHSLTLLFSTVFFQPTAQDIAKKAAALNDWIQELSTIEALPDVLQRHLEDFVDLTSTLADSSAHAAAYASAVAESASADVLKSRPTLVKLPSYRAASEQPEKVEEESPFRGSVQIVGSTLKGNTRSAQMKAKEEAWKKRLSLGKGLESMKEGDDDEEEGGQGGGKDGGGGDGAALLGSSAPLSSSSPTQDDEVLEGHCASKEWAIVDVSTSPPAEAAKVPFN